MPRFSTNLKKFVRGDAHAPAASVLRTANSDSGWINAEELRSLALTLAVTAVAGTTPTLDVVVEEASDSAGTNTRTVGAFAQKTGVSTERKSFHIADAYYRVRWTIGGTATPSFTFSTLGESK